MTTLSLTDLIDVVSASGTPKYNKLKKVKLRPAYNPAHDFYKIFRENVVQTHSQGHSKAFLDNSLTNLTDNNKVLIFSQLVSGYKKWWGRKDLQWFAPQSDTWTSSGVDIRINPELGLLVNGKPTLIKLYMKGEPLSKLRVNVIIHLLDITLSATAPAGCLMGVLDVRRSRLITSTALIDGLHAALSGEMAYISTTWNMI